MNLKPVGDEYSEPAMGCEVAIREGVAKAFLAAYLLTRSVRRAEAVTVRGLELWNPDRESPESLYLSIATTVNDELARDPQSTFSCLGADELILPAQLQRVLMLPSEFKQSFVSVIFSNCLWQAAPTNWAYVQRTLAAV